MAGAQNPATLLKMSTRAQITVEDSKVYVYKHSDGYPDGVMPILERLTKDFFKERGHDPEYFLAQVICAFSRDRQELHNELVKEYQAAVEKDPLNDWDRCMLEHYSKPDFLGLGVDTVIHPDIEYLYEVTKTGVIAILQPREGAWSKSKLTRADFMPYVEEVV